MKTLVTRLPVDNDVIHHYVNYRLNACSVRDSIAFPLYSVFVWTGESDSNTLRMNPYFFFQNGEKKSPFSKIARYVWMGPKSLFLCTHFLVFLLLQGNCIGPATCRREDVLLGVSRRRVLGREREARDKRLDDPLSVPNFVFCSIYAFPSRLSLSVPLKTIH